MAEVVSLRISRSVGDEFLGIAREISDTEEINHAGLSSYWQSYARTSRPYE